MKLLLSIVVLLVVVDYGASLQCYNCDTTQPGGYACADPFQSSRYQTSECPRPEEMERRLRLLIPGWRGGGGRTVGQHVCTTFSFTVVPETVLMRSCFSLGNDTCAELEAGVLTNNGVVNYCETCEEDGCNSRMVTTSTQRPTTTLSTTTVRPSSSTTTLSTTSSTKKPVSPLKCYSCDTTQPNNKCKDPFDKASNQLSPCPLEKSSDRLGLILLPGLQTRAGTEDVCTKFEFTVNRKRILMRSCFSLGKTTCDELKVGVLNNNGTLHFCETCRTEGCNLAPTLRAFSLLAALSALLVRVV